MLDAEPAPSPLPPGISARSGKPSLLSKKKVSNAPETILRTTRVSPASWHRAPSEVHEELLAIWPPIGDLPFPAKRPVSGLLLGVAGVGGAVVEERMVGLEAFLHGALTLLGIYTSVDSR